MILSKRFQVLLFSVFLFALVCFLFIVMPLSPEPLPDLSSLAIIRPEDEAILQWDEMEGFDEYDTVLKPIKRDRLEAMSLDEYDTVLKVTKGGPSK
jgi:hypothetical protein